MGTLSRGIGREEAAALLRSIVGLPVSRPWRGYGTALFLEFGRLRMRPPLKHPKGEFTLMAQWSWRVEGPRSIRFGSWSGDLKMDNGIASLAGLTVLEIRIHGRLPELSIALSGGRWVETFMTAEGQPAWAMFLRGGEDSDWISVSRGALVLQRGVDGPGGKLPRP